VIKKLFAQCCLVLLASTLLTPKLVLAQEQADGGESPKTIAELTAESDRVDGLFTLFRHRKTGKLHMLIRADQLDREFIYVAQSQNGAVQSGYVRGLYLVNDVVSVRRHYDRIELVAENTAFYYDPTSPLSRAADANQIPGILAVQKIVAEDATSGDMLIEAGGIFLSESLYQVKPSSDPEADPKSSYSMGSLSEEKSKILGVRSYPLNTDVEVEYVFEDPAPRRDLLEEAEEITDPRNVAVRVLHTFIQMPENDYRPRRDDPRVGFFTQRVTDLTANSPTPYRDVINRWHLVKQDPAAEISDPVEPIVWWIENTTPLEWREWIREAALGWNQAFEKAGFSNAIVVNVQPDDADWDAGDIRYNVLRWTSSPTPPWGGYGPSFVNPRTGQLIGADIMLEVAYVNVHMARGKAMDAGVPPVGNLAYCSLGHGLKVNTMLAQAISTATGLGSGMEQRIVHDTVKELILHELGHTLGLMHNMKATQLLTPEQAFDPEQVALHGLSGSVMDYPAVNFAPVGKVQTDFYMTHPGYYDNWAIEYGYSPALEDPIEEQIRLDAILARSSDPALAFGNDGDIVYTPGAGIDPRVNAYDMSSDAISYATDRIGLLRHTLENMEAKYSEAGKSYQELYNAFTIVMTEWTRAVNTISRYIGGVYVDRSVVGQAEGVSPFTPVSLVTQQAAMLALTRNLFAADAFSIPQDLYRHLQQQRRGFDFYGKTEDPKIHEQVLAVQKSVLDHLLNPVVLKRITDTRLYGNDYGLGLYLTDLTDAIFAEDMAGEVNTFRQNLQMEYVNRLALMVKDETRGGYDTPSQSMALHELGRVRKALGKRRGMGLETRAHNLNLMLVIDRALETLG